MSEHTSTMDTEAWTFACSCGFNVAANDGWKQSGYNPATWLMAVYHRHIMRPDDWDDLTAFAELIPARSPDPDTHPRSSEEAPS